MQDSLPGLARYRLRGHAAVEVHVFAIDQAMPEARLFGAVFVAIQANTLAGLADPAEKFGVPLLVSRAGGGVLETAALRARGA